MDTATDSKPPEPAEKAFTHKLTNGAVQILRMLVGGAGWAKGPVKQRKAIKLWKRLPKLLKPDGAVDEAWADAPYDLELTERQRDLVKECLRFFSDHGSMDNTNHSEALLYEFGVLDSSKDEE